MHPPQIYSSLALLAFLLCSVRGTFDFDCRAHYRGAVLIHSVLVLLQASSCPKTFSDPNESKPKCGSHSLRCCHATLAYCLPILSLNFASGHFPPLLLAVPLPGMPGQGGKASHSQRMGLFVLLERNSSL